MHKKKRGYRAFVLDGRVILRLLAGAVSFCIIFLIAYTSIQIADKHPPRPEDAAKQALNDALPALAAAETGVSPLDTILQRLKKGICFLLTFDYADKKTIFFSELPLARVVNESALFSMARQEALAASTEPKATPAPSATPLPDQVRPIKSIDSSQTTALKNSGSKILLNNQTTYSVDINEMLTAPLDLDMSRTGPKILILHTHATESYSDDGAQTYVIGESDRSQDTAQNVVRVGEEMAKVFQSAGIEVLHDKKLHDYPSYNGSYDNSLATAQWYLNKYPSIQMVFDIHRDAITYDDGTKAKTVTEINGKRAAQIMFVMGTDNGGLEHPNWKENLALAVQLQNSITQKYPYLMRGINLRKERFNGHTTKGSMIFEVGTSGNSLEEAIYSGQLVAQCVADFLNGL